MLTYKVADLKYVKPYAQVRVYWLDSVMSSGWKHVESYEFNYKPLCHVTLGFLAYRNKNYLSICQSLQDDWVNGKPAHIDSIMSIPLRAVIRVEAI